MVLVVAVVEVGGGGTRLVHAYSAHVAREVVDGAGVDAGAVGAVREGNRVGGTHQHAAPGRGVREVAQTAHAHAGEGQVVGPAARRTHPHAEGSRVLGVGVLHEAAH